jgi:hypothetical protein
MIQKILNAVHCWTAPPKPKPVVHRIVNCTESRLGDWHRHWTLMQPVRAVQAAAWRPAPVINGGNFPPLNLEKQLTTGGPRWRDAGTVEATQKAAAAKAKAEGEEIQPAPEVLF